MTACTTCRDCLLAFYPGSNFQMASGASSHSKGVVQQGTDSHLTCHVVHRHMPFPVGSKTGPHLALDMVCSWGYPDATTISWQPVLETPKDPARDNAWATLSEDNTWDPTAGCLPEDLTADLGSTAAELAEAHQVSAFMSTVQARGLLACETLCWHPNPSQLSGRMAPPFVDILPNFRQSLKAHRRPGCT